MKMINKRCKKCGYNDAHIKYYNVNDMVNSYGDKNDEVLKPYIENYKMTKEVMFLTCRTCGYRWLMDPLYKN